MNIPNPQFFEVIDAEKGTFFLKEEVMEFIMEHIEIENESYVEKPMKSRSYYIPDDPGEVVLSIEGKFPLSTLEDAFGALSEEEREYLLDDFKESESFHDFLKDMLQDAKDGRIESFSFEKNIALEKGCLVVEAIGEEFTIYAYEEEF